MRCVAILNKDGGTLKTENLDILGTRITEAFGAHGHEVSVRVVAGPELLDSIERAADEDDVEVILIGGGDGSVSAAAARLWQTDKALGILPAGTMNLFARTLGVPLGLDAAVDALAAGRLLQCDIATANGQPFVHQFSVGIHPKLIEEREKYDFGSRLGKIFASVRALLDSFARPPRFKAELKLGDDAPISHRFSVISISNNPFGKGHLPYADHPDEGTLGVYTAGPLTSGEAAQLATDLVLGNWGANDKLDEKRARKAVLRFPATKPSDKASIDGEVIALAPKVEIETHPGALRVWTVAEVQDGV